MFSEGPVFDVDPIGSLTRAKTTINVAPNARERSATVGSDTLQSIRDNDPPAATVLGRSNTATATNRVSGSSYVRTYRTQTRS
jgi:hypothetical protein